jgi:hypothetical protein
MSSAIVCVYLEQVKYCAIMSMVMRSARPSSFVDTQTLLDTPDTGQPTGRDARSLPPASDGLRAPAAVSGRADKRARAEHPAPSGPLSEERAQNLLDLTLRLMDKLSPKEIAIEAGVSADARPVKQIIKHVRQRLTERAEFYLEAHAVATIQAAVEGDAKPAQWALERINADGEHIVDPVDTEKPQAAPTFNIGFSIGGIPQPSMSQKVAAPPALDGEVVKP